MPYNGRERFNTAIGADQREAREQALIAKREAQRQSKDQDPYDGVVERSPSLLSRLRMRFKR